MENRTLIADEILKLIPGIEKRGRCPHCGDSMDSDDIVCQTCGYPDND